MSYFIRTYSASSPNNYTIMEVAEDNISDCFNPPSVNASRSSHTLQQLDYTLTGPLMVIVVIVGLASNAFCISVFARRFRLVRIYFYLLILALWDVSLEIGAFFMFGLPTVLYGSITLYGPYSPTFPFFYFLSNIARNGSVWIVVAVAFERYLALCHPYKFTEWNTERRVYALLAIVSFSALIYGIPRFLELEASTCRHPLTRDILPSLVATSLRKNRIYWLVYRVAGGFIFYSVGPFVLLTILTIRISLEIGRKSKYGEDYMLPMPRRKNGRRESQFVRFFKSLERNNNDEEKKNINHWMHVAVITKFLIFHCTPTVLDICGLIDPKMLFTDSGRLAGHISNLLVVVNSSCNFFIYLQTSAHFKRDLSDCMHRRRRQPTATFL